MKANNIIKIALPLMAGALLTVACDDEPAVGTPLNPTAEENYGAKVYVYQSGVKANTAETTVIQTPVNVILPEDTFDVFVRLTAPVQEDVSVSLSPDETATAAYGNDATALPASAIDVINPTVVIKAGEKQSSQPVRITLKDDDAYKTINGTGVAVLKLSTDSKAVAMAQQYNYYDVLVSKVVTNLKSQSKNDLAKLTQIDVNKYKVSIDDEETFDLSDSNTDTYSFYYAPYEIVMQFDNPQTISGLSYQFGYSRYYAPSVVEILTSDDGETWISQTDGEVSDEYGASRVTDVVPWVFYSAVKCKYVKLRCVQCPYGVWYGDDYNTPIVSEVRLYE